MDLSDSNSFEKKVKMYLWYEVILTCLRRVKGELRWFTPISLQSV